MKRVFLVTDYFRPAPGGMEALFTGLARQWSSDSIEVFVTSDPALEASVERERVAFDRTENYRVHRMGPPGSIWPFSRRRQFVERYVRECLARFAPDHLLLADIRKENRVFVQVAAERGVGYSVFLHGNDLKNRLGLLNLLDRRLALGAQNIFAVSRYIARGARGFGIPEERITVIPPGFEPRWSRSRREALPDFLEQRIRGKTVIVGLGPLVPRKGLHFAIQALATIRDLASRLHLVLMGSGPEFAYIKELVRIYQLEQMVSMTDFVPDRMLATILSRADFLVRPGAEREDDVESLGTVFMEAAWFGMPVIAGRLGGIEEIVRHGVSGFVIEPGNVTELADRIRQMVESEKLRSRFSRNARDIARRDFDMSRTCSAIEMRI